MLSQLAKNTSEGKFHVWFTVISTEGKIVSLFSRNFGTEPLVLHGFITNTFLVCINIVMLLRSNILVYQYWHYRSSITRILMQYLAHVAYLFKKLYVSCLLKAVYQHDICISNMQRYLSSQNGWVIDQHRWPNDHSGGQGKNMILLIA